MSHPAGRPLAPVAAASPPRFSGSGGRHDRRRRARPARPRAAFGDLGAPGPGEGSAHQLAALSAWLRAHGVDFSDRAMFCRVRGMGLGGVATRPLAQGDVIFSLPTHAASADRPRDDANDAAPPAAPVPLVMTTRAVIDRDGPLGRLARALHAAGLVAEEEEEEEEDEEHHHRDRRHPLRRRRDGFSSDSRRARLSRRLGGVVREGDHELPLDVSRASILALGILRTCAEAAEAPKRAPGSESPPRLSSSSPASSFHAHWRAYADLLPRETDALLEWSDEELDALQGSPLARRAKDRRAIVDAVYDEAVTELLAIDPGLFGAPPVDAEEGEEQVEEKATLDVDEAERKKKPSSAAAESTSYASREAFRWAFATVLARAFAFPDLRDEMGLCPGLDLFNHGCEAAKCVVEGVDDEEEEEEEGEEGEGGIIIEAGASETTLLAADEAASSSSSSEVDASDADANGAALASLGPRVTLRAGVGGAEPGEQLLHAYADRANGGALLEFGFTHRDVSRRARAAVDVSLAPLLPEDERERSRRVAALEAAGLAGGEGRGLLFLTREASNVPRSVGAFERGDLERTDDESDDGGAFDVFGAEDEDSRSRSRVFRDEERDEKMLDDAVDARRVRGVRCLGADAMRAARVLTLADAELDAIRDWDDAADGSRPEPYDGAAPFSASHERRCRAALASTLRETRDAYDRTYGDVAKTTCEEDDAILAALDRMERALSGETDVSIESAPHEQSALARRPEIRSGVAEPRASFAEARAEKSRAARRRRRARMAVTVRRGEKLLLEELAASFEGTSG